MENFLLVGPPNSGKSSIFNMLSGKFRKVSNYSGITVDNALGELISNNSQTVKLSVVDLPGINSLMPGSFDEFMTIKAILGLDSTISSYSGIALVLDAHRLEFSLGLLLQLKELVGDNLIAVINKVDSKDVLSDEQVLKLQEKIGIKILNFSTLNNSAETLDNFLRANVQKSPFEVNKKILMTKRSLEACNGDVEKFKNKITIVDDLHESELLNKLEKYHRDARKILSDVIGSNRDKKVLATEKIDQVLLHPIFGTIVFCTIFYLIFNAIYSWSAPVMDFIDTCVGFVALKVGNILPDGLFKSLIIDGVIAGVGGVIVFLPQIIILFFLLSLLELSGYVARAAFLTDRVMGFFGLSGKSFLPFLSGFACAVPAIMSTRTISNKLERVVTIMTIPLITCSARLPVYVLLIGTFIPKTKIWGIFNLQALSFFFLYFLGSLSALVIAKILRLTYFKGDGANFIMDLPLYQKPSIKTALKHSFRQGKVFLKKAGTVILGFSIVFWVASTFPRPNEQKLSSLSENEKASYTLENSIIGRVGKTIEPILTPLGMNWKMGVGILVAYGARELFVSAMGTMYALGNVDESSDNLHDRLKNDVWPDSGKPVFNLGTVWALLLFFVFSMQCTSTLAIAIRETGSYALPIAMFIYMGILGYGSAFLAFHLLS